MSHKKPLLNEPSILPTKEVLQKVLGKSYAVFEEFSAMLTEQGITLDWKYYNDSKAWLCKVSYKKKTVFWLSIWGSYFQASFYFLERHLEGIMALGIDNSHYTLAKEWGKMIPLFFYITKSEQLPDVLKMVEYKKTCK
jgi:hypothetical protein